MMPTPKTPEIDELPPPREMVAELHRVVGALGLATTRIGGSIGFRVIGHGSWRLDLSVPGGQWHEDRSEAEVVVWATDWAFALLFLRPESVPELLELGQLRVAGEVERLISLGDAIARGTDTVGVRLAGKGEL